MPKELGRECTIGVRIKVLKGSEEAVFLGCELGCFLTKFLSKLTFKSIKGVREGRLLVSERFHAEDKSN